MIPSYPSTPHWPASLTVHREDRYHGDPTFFLDKPVVVTEKLDGGNTGVCMGEVYARSSGQPTHQEWFSYMKSVTLPKVYALPSNLCLYAEDCYAVHSLEYDLLPDSFFLYNVLDRCDENIGTENIAGDRFWAWNAVKALAGIFDLELVPVVYEGWFNKIETITEFFNDMIVSGSKFGPICEGFVMRVACNFAFEEFDRNMCKFVRAHHVQTDEHWTKHWKPAKIARPKTGDPRA